MALSITGTVQIAGGGTGANTAPNALTNLGLPNTTTGTAGSLVLSTSPTLTGTLTAADVYSTGKLLIGSPTSLLTKYSGGSYTPIAQVLSTSFENSSSLNALFAANTNSPVHYFAKSRGTTIGSYTTVAASDVLGSFSFAGADGTAFSEGARIQAITIGTVTTGIVSAGIDIMTADRGTATISTISRVNATSIVTVTCTGTHFLKVGDSITISGVTDTSFNGSFTVRSITNSTIFTLTQAGTTASSTEGLLVVANNNPATNLRVAPGGYTAIGSNSALAGRRLNVTGVTNASTEGYGVNVGATAVPDNTSFSGYGTSISTSINGSVAYTIPDLYHYNARSLTANADSTVTNQYGFYSNNTLVQATNNQAFHAANTAAVTTGKSAYGFYSAINTATGGGSAWGVYAAGTANNYFNGNVGVGIATPTAKLEVAGVVHSTTGGFKFPDSTTQSTAFNGGLPLVIVTATTQAATAGNHYVLTNVAQTTLTLPSTPTSGAVIWVTVGNALTTNTILRNGSNIQSIAEDLTLDASYASVQMRYINSTIGWTFI